MSVCVQNIVKRRLGGGFGIGVLFVIGAVSAGIAMGHFASPPSPTSDVASVTKTAVLQDSAWLSESYWRRKKQKKLRNNSFSGRSQLGFNPFTKNFKAKARSKSTGGGNYRTVCVRLCDGYYLPISASTTRSRFAGDEQACRSSCSSETRLFHYRNSGGSPETMTDLRGRAYSKLRTAFLYRTSYNKSCQCRPDPWSKAEKQRHAMYATKDWQRKARRLAKQQRKNNRYASRSHRTSRGTTAPQAISAPLAILPPAVFGQLAPLRPITSRRRYSQVRIKRAPSVKRRRPRRSRSKKSRKWRSFMSNGHTSGN
ncbi:MAG: hypothetical protein ACI89J_002031 [Hyphomicrobiaceae bacterium]|jgi:hypothetical protein